MIGKIQGVLSEVDGNIALIETSTGIFYNVYFTNALLSQYMLGSDISVYTYHHIREDLQLLFAFQDKQEYKLFLLLLGVSGVGAKSAYSIISHCRVTEIVKAVKTNDVKVLTQIPGLGKKTALKIILELSGKFKSEFVFKNEYVSAEEQTVVDALAALGFSPTEAREILPKLEKSDSMEEKISAAIRLLGTA